MSPAKSTAKTNKKTVVNNSALEAGRRLVIKPRMSEKAYSSALERNTYIFDVPLNSNKAIVAAAVTAQFKVEVVNTKIVIVKGKPKRSYQKRNRPIEGKRVDYKKAYVRLKEGHSIDIFGEAEEAKSDKTDKKTAKKEAK